MAYPFLSFYIQLICVFKYKVFIFQTIYSWILFVCFPVSAFKLECLMQCDSFWHSATLSIDVVGFILAILLCVSFSLCLVSAHLHVEGFPDRPVWPRPLTKCKPFSVPLAKAEPTPDFEVLKNCNIFFFFAFITSYHGTWHIREFNKCFFRGK